MCDLLRSSSSRSYTKSCKLSVPRNKHNTKNNLVSTGSQIEVNVSSKTPSVQFNATVLSLNDPEDLDPAEDDHLPALPSSSKSTFTKGKNKRESIISTFSQVAVGSRRPSIFSRLSDQLSQQSFPSSLYTWNYSRVFLILFS